MNKDYKLYVASGSVSFVFVFLMLVGLTMADNYFVVSKSQNSTIGVYLQEPVNLPWGIDGLYLLANSTNQSFKFADAGDTYSALMTINGTIQAYQFIIENQTNVVATNSTGGGGDPHRYINKVQFNVYNFSVVQRKDYNVSLNVTDPYGNWSKFFVKQIKFIENPQSFERVIYTVNSSNISFVNKSDTVNVSIDMKFRTLRSVGEAGLIYMALYDHNPEGTNATASALGKFIDIEGDSNVTLDMQWTNFRLHYKDSDLVVHNISDESAMAFYFYNETTGQWQKMDQTYTDTANNFVYMNTTHFSTYGVFEVLSTASSSSSGSSSSGGGGGGSVTSTTTSAKEIKSVNIGTEGTIVTMTNEEVHGIVDIQIEVLNPVNSVQISVQKLEDKPATITQEVSGNIYEYIEITKSGTVDSNVKNAKIKFVVNKSWATEKNIDVNTVALNRYSNGWTKLSTRLVSSDADSYIFESDSPGFSTFAITGEAVAETPTETTPETTTTTETTQTTSPTYGGIDQNILIIIGVIIAAVIIAVVVFMIRRRTA